MSRIIVVVGILLYAISVMAQKTENMGPEFELFKNSASSDIDNVIQLIIQNQLIKNEIDGLNSNVVLKQVGSENQLTNIQNLTGQSSYISSATQFGSGNTAYISQTGTNHQTILMQNNTGVLGSEDPPFGNEANLWSEGFNAQNVVVQVGNNNLINQFIENYYAVTRSAVAVQLGNDNKIELALLDRGELNNLMGAMVTQTGDANSAELVLNQSDASYFKINQSGGAEIKVTQTDFYFPMK